MESAGEQRERGASIGNSHDSRIGWQDNSRFFETVIRHDDCRRAFRQYVGSVFMPVEIRALQTDKEAAGLHMS